MTKTYYWPLCVAMIVAGLWAFITPRARIDDRHAAEAAAAGSAGESQPLCLADQCQSQRELLSRQLGRHVDAQIHPPFVLAGDLPTAELERIHSGLIRPACQTLQTAYFDSEPDRPITVLVFSEEAAYRSAAKQLFFDRQVSRFGYFKPGRWTLLVNLQYGPAPLWHELTHALTAADFPQAPPWLKEGLATLHEAAEMDDSTQPPSLRGRANWRLPVLQRAISAGDLPPLVDFVRQATLHGAGEAVSFAYAQAFCLFLQQQGILGDCYRGVRAAHRNDPTGEETLALLLPGFSTGKVDEPFQRWATSQTVDPLLNIAPSRQADLRP